MDFNESVNQLSTLYKGKDWFNDIGTDTFGRIVVYVKHMNHEVLKDIPDMVAGKQILVHFIGSKTATREQFVKTDHNSKFMQVITETQANGDSENFGQVLDELAFQFEDEEQSLRHLQNELDRLEKICGSNALQDIFYEVQDGNNAVTNLSSRYPGVRKDIEKLFDQYGFDVIYEELDG